MTLIALLLWALVSSAPAQSDLPAAQPNTNRSPAGTLRGKTLQLTLEARAVQWHATGDSSPPALLLAFSETGKAPEIPGPLIRVPVGTRIILTVKNLADSTLVLHLLSDSAVVAAGQSGVLIVPATHAGTYFYWATTTRVALADRAFEDSQLSGSLVVDPPGRVKPDRVFVISQFVQRRNPAGRPALPTSLYVINGRAWPVTEPLTYAMGDSVRWRIINTSIEPHPMHLHGFYFRVDASGLAASDTTYQPTERRMAVTEVIFPGETRSIAWSPNRPGTWLFHCHFAIHTLPNVPIRSGPPPPPTPGSVPFLFRDGLAGHDPSDHVRNGMGGLILAITVAPPPGWTVQTPTRRSIRLLVQHNGKTGIQARYGFALPNPGEDPPRDSVQRPSPTLVLTRGEPTSIMVVNRGDTPTQIHWHGLEIENYFDGVVGVGGYQGMQTPAIMPGDSFEVKLTAPRAGSFMYHSHMDDARQMLLGLWGSIVVLEPGEVWNPDRDKVFLVAIGGARPQLNGVASTDTLVLDQGTEYRFRLMNLSVAGIFNVTLMRDSLPVQWTPLAKDGFALAGRAASPREARLTSAVGETYDVGWRAPSPGLYRLEYRNPGNNALVITQLILAR